MFQTTLALPSSAVTGLRFDDAAHELSVYAVGHLTPIYCCFKSEKEYKVAKGGLVKLLAAEYGLDATAVGS